MHPNPEISSQFTPIILTPDSYNTRERFTSMLQDFDGKIILDLFSSQKKELIKIRNPKNRLAEAEIDSIYNEWLLFNDPDLAGAWIYYSWTNRLIHILDKSEFIELRTSRNQYKISADEQNSMVHRTIGIIGLSVGHSVAMNIATERICGKLKLSDFDTIELSNLNRIKTGIHNIGINKCVVTAREISEIDPFLEVECYPEGISDANLPDFLTGGGNLDILIDECDDLQLKLSCRDMARRLKIPVVMETSDRGMLDVERFDLDSDRPILHGILNGIPKERLENISNGDRVPLVMKIIDGMNSSNRGRVSLLEVGQSISTWPQLASAVTLGGGVVTDVCRRILLNQFTDSGRYYVDLEELIANKVKELPATVLKSQTSAFDLNNAIHIADSIAYDCFSKGPGDDLIRQIAGAGSRAPSSGNDQPWKWLLRKGRLHLFHDQARSSSFANYNNMEANLALGAAYQNVILKSKKLGYHVRSKLFPVESKPNMLAVISFVPENKAGTESVYAPDLVDFIESRTTNRHRGTSVPIIDDDYNALQEAAESIDGANFRFITDKEVITKLGRIVGECDLTMILNDKGHFDFFERNMRWTMEDTENTNDGISVKALAIPPSKIAALSIIRDKKIAEILRKIGGGNALVEETQQSVLTASCLTMLTLPKSAKHNFFYGGMAMQRIWLRAEQLGLTIQPLLSPLSLFARLDSGEGLSGKEKNKLKDLRTSFRNLICSDPDSEEILLLKISKTEVKAPKTKRLPLNELLFIVNDEI